MIGEQEVEIKEMRAIVLRTGANQVQKLEEENKSATKELKDVKAKIKNLEERITKQDTVVSIPFEHNSSLRTNIHILLITHRSDKDIRSDKDTSRKSNKIRPGKVPKTGKGLRQREKRESPMGIEGFRSRW